MAQRDETTEFMLQRIEVTYSIWRKIRDMNQQVRQGIDEAIRSLYESEDWLGHGWKVDELEEFDSKEGIRVTKKELLSGSSESPFWLTLYQEGAPHKAIWGLFNEPPTRDEAGAYVEVKIDKENLKNGEKVGLQIQKAIRARLENAGFRLKPGGQKQRFVIFIRQIWFNSEFVLNGLKEGEWGQALETVRSNWTEVEKALTQARVWKTLQDNKK